MKPHLEPLNCVMAFVIIAGSFSLAQSPLTPSRTLTSSQAETLVIATLSKQQRRLHGIEAEQFNNPGSIQFLFFTVVWAPPADQRGNVVVGNYAVDPKTGDVWSATMSCMEESSRQLRALQRHLRTELGLSDAEYRHLKTTGPLCEK
jgi:hypothetical protein